MATRRAHRKYARILREDENICLLRTAAGLYRMHRYAFSEMLKLPGIIQMAPRVAKVAPEYYVIINEGGVQLFKNVPEWDYRIRTFSELIDRLWIYSMNNISAVERERETARQYGLHLIAEEVKR